MVTVAITQNADIKLAISEALAHLPLDRLFSGKRVAIKPNETWATPGDKTGVTQPDTLRTVDRRK